MNESDVKKSDSFFYCNFSDVTVIGWVPFSSVLKKADKWEELDEKISKYYVDENGDELPDDQGGDLCDIGETAARAFGFM